MDVTGDGDRSEEGIGPPGRKYNHVGLWRWVKTAPRDGLRIIFLRPTESSAMGKSSARKARERKLAMEYASTPVTDKGLVESEKKARGAAPTISRSMPRHPLISDAAKGGAVNQPPECDVRGGPGRARSRGAHRGAARIGHQLDNLLQARTIAKPMLALGFVDVYPLVEIDADDLVQELANQGHSLSFAQKKSLESGLDTGSRASRIYSRTRKKQGKRGQTAGLCYDARAPGFEPKAWPHVACRGTHRFLLEIEDGRVSTLDRPTRPIALVPSPFPSPTSPAATASLCHTGRGPPGPPPTSHSVHAWMDGWKRLR